MDGATRPVGRSLRLRLSLWLSLAITGTALVAVSASFVSAFAEANEFQDDVLRQIASMSDRAGPQQARVSEPDSSSEEAAESRVFVQAVDARRPAAGHRGTGRLLSLANGIPDGLQTVSVEGQRYRVLVRTLESGRRLAVAQSTSARDEIARDSALRTLMPLLALLPILLMIVALLIRKAFRPVMLLATDVDRRDERDLRPVTTESMPAEIQPFVRAINRMLQRVGSSVQTQKRFVADAAHELRSPLAALSLQAERLCQAGMSVEAGQRLAVLRQGIERAGVLINQLLELARAESAEQASTEGISVQRVYRRVLEDLLPLAEARGIDVGIAGELDAQVFASEAELFVLVRNLVDNAVRYTPEGGRVDLSVSAGTGQVTMLIEDTGPGIPEAERGRVFDAFYRSPANEQTGSGLGLAIVLAICRRLGAQVGLDDAGGGPGSGLRVTVSMPVREPRART